MDVKTNYILARSEQEHDYEYANIAVAWNQENGVIIPPYKTTKTKVMWSHESVYGVIGNKVGDFVEFYMVNGYKQEGIITRREIAEAWKVRFSGLRINELVWVENKYEKILKNGKPRKKTPKWLPESKPDLVHLFSDNYISEFNADQISTDFYQLVRVSQDSSYLCCSDEAADWIEKQGYKNLNIRKTAIAI